MKRLAVLASAAVLALLCVGPQAAIGKIAAKHGQASSKTATGPLVDRGGKVLAASRTYAIFWGPRAAFPADEISLIPQELAGFSGSGYLGLAKQYMRGASVSTSFGGSFFDGSTPPNAAPSLSGLGAEVARMLPAGTSPDPNGLYLVYTSNDGTKSYCAYHDQAKVNGVTVQVAYVPNTSGVAICDPGNLNGSTVTEGTRSVADSTAHEFIEAITDPSPGATWVSQGGYEIGDLCEYNPEGIVALTGTTWQLQAEWSNSAGGCAFS